MAAYIPDSYENSNVFLRTSDSLVLFAALREKNSAIDDSVFKDGSCVCEPTILYRIITAPLPHRRRTGKVLVVRSGLSERGDMIRV